MAGKSSLLIDVNVCSTSELSLIVISHVRRAPVTLRRMPKRYVSKRLTVTFCLCNLPRERRLADLVVVDQDRLLGNKQHALFQEVKITLYRLDTGLDCGVLTVVGDTAQKTTVSLLT